MRIVEVRIRTFHTDGDLDVTPSAAITYDLDNAKYVLRDSVLNLANMLDGMLKDAPITDLRPMTSDEIREFLATERKEESGDAVICN